MAHIVQGLGFTWLSPDFSIFGEIVSGRPISGDLGKLIPGFRV